MSPAAKKVAKKAASKKAVAKKSPKAARKSSAKKAAAAAAPGQVASSAELSAMIRELAAQIVRDHKDPGRVLVLGVRSRGVPIADRLRRELKKAYNVKSLPGGILDITLYRDDLSALGAQPMVRDSEINHDVTGADVILVDDVLFTGRTARAALDEIVDFGRPARIRLAVLVDRGWREYPIQADYVGKTIETKPEQVVHVRLAEIDGADEIILVDR